MNPSIVFVCGSLRKESYNRKLMAIAMDQAKAMGAQVSEAAIGDLPLYDEDLEVDPWPVAAKRFYDQITAADAVILVSPEYNYSIPGGLKNALDWASVGDNAWKDKIVALMGVSIGNIGTARGQMHLRQALLGTGPIWVVPQPQVCVGPASIVFAEDGKLSDPKMDERIRALIQNLLTVVKKMK